MNMSGTQRIAAARAEVWAALNDAETLKKCIPGCQELVQLSPTEMTARVVLKLGPVKSIFTGKVVLSELDAPNGYTIAGEGQGGIAGFAKGHALVRLAPDGEDATLLTYDVKADVAGKIAQLGSRLIDQTAKKLANEFFTAFGQALAPPPASGAAA